MASIPNSNIIPCPDPTAYGCLEGFCEASGHDGCSSIGSINDFGTHFQTGLPLLPTTGVGLSRPLAWTREICARDDDEDEMSNGDELGDGCCAWQGRDSDLLFYDTLVGVARNISNPSSDLSVSPRPACAGDGPPQPPAFYVSSITTTTITLTWLAGAGGGGCVCEFSAAATYAPTAFTSVTLTANVRGDAASLVLCSLPPDTDVSVTLVGLNHDGRSDAGGPATPVAARTLPLPPWPEPPSEGDCAAYAPQNTDGGTYTVYMNSIPALGGYVNGGGDGDGSSSVLSPDTPTVGAMWAAAPLVLLLAAAVAMQATTHCDGGSGSGGGGGGGRGKPRARTTAYCGRCGAEAGEAAATYIRDPLYNSSAACGHRHSCGGAHHAHGGCTRRAGQWMCRALDEHSGWRDFGQSSRVFSAAVGVAVAAVALCWVLSSAWYAQFTLYSPAQVPGAVYRGAGYALAFCFGLQMLPVTRWSPWMHLAGVSFERGIMWHRWVGAASLLLAAVHGVGLAVEYGLHSPLGGAYLFRWSRDLPVNPLPGTIAGFALLALGATAWGPVRRRCYELFLLGHALYPAVFALGVVHTAVSETPTLPLLLPGIALLAFDHAAMLADLLLRPVTVRRALLPAQAAGVGGAPGLLFLECHKGAVFGWRWLDGLWPFVYAPGQYMVLLVPAVSLVPHPFSIASAPDAARPGFFTLCVRAAPCNSSSYTSLLASTALEASRCAALAEGEEGDDDEEDEGAKAPSAAASASADVGTVAPASPSPTSSPQQGGGGGGGRSARVSAARKPAARVSLNPLLRLARASFGGGGGGGGGGGSPAFAAAADSRAALDGGIGGGVELAVSPARGSHQYEASDGAAALGAFPSSLSAFSGSRNRFPLSVMASGPVGMPTLPLANYQHFLLFAGGIGVTPIASLHYALVNGVPVGERACAPSALLQRAAGAAAARLCGGRTGAVSSAPTAAAAAAAAAQRTRLRSLVTVWTLRDAPLLQMFSRSLAAEPAAAAAAGSGTSRSVRGGDSAAASAADDAPFVSTIIHQTAPSLAAARADGTVPHGGGGGGPIVPAGFHLRGGRPDIAGIVREAVARVTAEADAEAEAACAWGASAAATTGSATTGSADKSATVVVANALHNSGTEGTGDVGDEGDLLAPIRIACVVCGPQQLVDAVYRAAAAHPQSFGRVEVHVHKELFAF